MITTVTCSIRRGHLTKNAGTHFCTLHSTVLHKYSLKRVKIYRIFFYEQFKKVFNFYFLKQRHVYRIVSKHLLCVCVCVYIYICIVLHKHSLKTSCCMHDVCVFETVTVFLYDLILDQEMVILLRWPHLRS